MADVAGMNMKDGFAGMALILPTASSSVPRALGLAGLSKPIWLSEICRKVSPRISSADARSIRPAERGTPPAIVHRTPVPTQVMHSSTFRRSNPSRLSNSVIFFSSYPTSCRALPGKESRGGGTARHSLDRTPHRRRRRKPL
jgi:hypothetical protein